MLKLTISKIAFLSFLALSACQGTDILDDAIVDPKFELSANQTVFRLGETATIGAKYFDEYGIEKIVPYTWVSTQPQIVSVNSGGKITALTAGSAQIYTQYQNTTANAINITVVANDNAIAKVTITASKTSLTLNESLNLGISAQNINGQTVNGQTVQWFSENENILKVDANGKITAVANGVASIYGKIDGIKSNSIDFTVGSSNELMGSFIATGGYRAVGNATLKTVNGEVILNLSSNFQTSFALGTFIYLANSTNGATVRSVGLELGEIKTNGAKTFNVSQIKSGVALRDYKYVIIFCKPASLTFGYAELK
ncbi:DM13 domain-containing protein [Pedobacter alpinus]|uniref:DM13 domain-containing protein n=1 Tax=Pedobacter alpinus TaxID=1590643 RepID=A0ABW5TNI4_9SPHI